MIYKGNAISIPKKPKTTPLIKTKNIDKTGSISLVLLKTFGEMIYPSMIGNIMHINTVKYKSFGEHTDAKIIAIILVSKPPK